MRVWEDCPQRGPSAELLALLPLMKLIAGAWRGRRLIAPAGLVTRPTSERLRQALFDMLWHASWGGRALLKGALVLDVFAGTGALGLEALSRGAGRAEFLEQDRAALAALRANISACGAGDITMVHTGDACRPRPGPAAGVVFLDPPYGLGLVDTALAALKRAERLGPETVVVAEIARSDQMPRMGELLAERSHGAGRIVIGRGCATA